MSSETKKTLNNFAIKSSWRLCMYVNFIDIYSKLQVINWKNRLMMLHVKNCTAHYECEKAELKLFKIVSLYNL